MAYELKLGRFFRYAHGKIVIAQWPNIPVYGWLACSLLSLLVPSKPLQSGFDDLGTAFLFVWAYLELTAGVNHFRRLLGGIVLAYLSFQFLHP